MSFNSLPIRGMLRFTAQAGVAFASWNVSNNKVKLQLNNPHAFLGALVVSGLLQCAKPYLQDYLTGKAQEQLHGKLSVETTRAMMKGAYDALPFIILFGTSFAFDVSLDQDKTAFLALSALSQTASSKLFDQAPGNIQWHLPCLVVNNTTVHSYSGIDAHSIVSFTSTSPVVTDLDDTTRTFDGIPNDKLGNNFSMPTAAQLEAVTGDIATANRALGLSAIQLQGNEMLVDLVGKNQEHIEQFLTWWSTWSQDSENQIQELTIRGASEKVLKQMFGDDPVPTLAKLQVLRLPATSYRQSQLVEIKMKNPHIAVFDLRNGKIVPEGNGRVAVADPESINSMLASRRDVVLGQAPRCIVILDEGNHNIKQAFADYHKHLVSEVYTVRNDKGTITRDDAAERLVPNLARFPAMAFIQDVNHLRGLEDIPNWDIVIDRIKQNFPNARNFDFGITLIQFPQFVRILRELKPLHLNFALARQLFTKPDESDAKKLVPETLGNILAEIKSWALSAGPKENLKLEIEKAPVHAQDSDPTDKEKVKVHDGDQKGLIDQLRLISKEISKRLTYKYHDYSDRKAKEYPGSASGSPRADRIDDV